MYDFGRQQPLMGYRIAYRQDHANHCPGCDKSHWMVGRVTAECAFCGTALPLIEGMSLGMGRLQAHGVSRTQMAA
ncbi:hypothetical protein [Sphingomonas sp.]|uniref:hypothetical protein n=1 Tax=Sphingomonas sp. TaxID=28214 RepID=UPI001B145620|nr:hypothetical protein [Sphingomonas sp.]MBO9713750.1 hypothetical protein [Sphingomonas sp.]